MSAGPLLGVWAHPDDEAHLSAGLMASARRAGRRVVVVTMTAGERGTADPEHWPPERLDARRRAELSASLAALDVDEHYVLGVPDGGCSSVDGTALVTAFLVLVQPSTIVTFGPDGMTGHPDHRAVSSWTTAAWRTAGCPGDLWYATVTPEFHRDFGDVNDATGIWSEQDEPPCTEVADLAHRVELEGAALDQKLDALRAHASQTAPLLTAVGPRTYRRWWATEAFVAAPRLRTPVPQRTSVARAAAATRGASGS
jgi:LmbE family N-acetylglucosaminyl deacetylase